MEAEDEKIYDAAAKAHHSINQMQSALHQEIYENISKAQAIQAQQIWSGDLEAAAHTQMAAQ